MGLFAALVRTARRRSPWIFHANSGSCNGCDIELLACLTPRFDVEQLGVRNEGSPRHADILVVSGPVTRNTCEALETVYAQMPDPKVVLALGSCPATGNVFAGSPAVVGPLHRVLPVDLYVPGCPPRPDAIVAAVAEAAAILAGDRPRPAEPEAVPPRTVPPEAGQPGTGQPGTGRPGTRNPEAGRHGDITTGAPR
jgi:membrane-bound hydrogenase subunit mbhJ